MGYTKKPQSEYGKKLLDPRWQKLRLQIFERDDWTCRICGAKTQTLHVHHACYWPGAEPWEADSDTLYTLCANCHGDDLHQEQKEATCALLALLGRMDIRTPLDLTLLTEYASYHTDGPRWEGRKPGHLDFRDGLVDALQHFHESRDAFVADRRNDS